MSRRVIEASLGVYKYALSPFLHAVSGVPGACRFQPTCSEYAAIAISEYGIVRGGWMALRRLLRCHPFHRGGFDPVPAKHLVQCGQLSGSGARQCSASYHQKSATY